MTTLHNYLKRHYELGEYDHQNYHMADLDDYELGRQKAQERLNRGLKLHYFPYQLLRICNVLSGQKLVELVKYIQGYNSLKHKKNEQ